MFMDMHILDMAKAAHSRHATSSVPLRPVICQSLEAVTIDMRVRERNAKKPHRGGGKAGD